MWSSKPGSESLRVMHLWLQVCGQEYKVFMPKSSNFNFDPLFYTHFNMMEWIVWYHYGFIQVAWQWNPYEVNTSVAWQTGSKLTVMVRQKPCRLRVTGRAPVSRVIVITGLITFIRAWHLAPGAQGEKGGKVNWFLSPMALQLIRLNCSRFRNGLALYHNISEHTPRNEIVTMGTKS